MAGSEVARVMSIGITAPGNATALRSGSMGTVAGVGAARMASRCATRAVISAAASGGNPRAATTRGTSSVAMACDDGGAALSAATLSRSSAQLANPYSRAIADWASWSANAARASWSSDIRANAGTDARIRSNASGSPRRCASSRSLACAFR